MISDVYRVKAKDRNYIPLASLVIFIYIKGKDVS